MSRASAPSQTLLLASLATPGAICLGLFFLAPLAVVGVESLQDGGGGFSRLLSQPAFWSGLRNTLVLGATAGAISVVIGSLVAWHLAQIGERMRTALMFVIALPLTFSGLVVAYGFILGFGRAGFFTLTLEALFGVDPAAFAAFVYSPQGLAFVYSYYLIPRVVMLMVPVLVNFDRNQLAAAESLGAGRTRAIADILVPQVFPAALVAFCLVAAVAIGAYGTALALVGSQVNILPLQLFTAVSDVNADYARTAALAMILTLLCSLAMAVGEAVAVRGETGKGH